VAEVHAVEIADAQDDARKAGRFQSVNDFHFEFGPCTEVLSVEGPGVRPGPRFVRMIGDNPRESTLARGREFTEGTQAEVVVRCMA
jgi:hypothetical protein